jgi:tripartite-type tricarboxylate transporter receptor subunit TctC
MSQKLFGLLAFTLLLPSVAAAASADDFYKGKTVRIVVGFSAGGGFDTYARAITRHMSKHIPGQPAIVVENMTGAGSLIAANHVYKVAKPDGLTIGHFIGGLFLGQVLGQAGVEFDARKFEFIGAPITDHVVCALTKASGITSVEKWMASKTPVKMGGIAPGTSTPDNATRILKAALGLPIQLVTGYKGTADVRLAAESGEDPAAVGVGIRSKQPGAKRSKPATPSWCSKPIARIIASFHRFRRRSNWRKPRTRAG